MFDGVSSPEAARALEELVDASALPRAPGLWDQGMPVDEGRILGGLIGVAVGDALGRPAESLPAGVVREKFGRLEEMLEDKRGPAGSVTDDTQLTLIVAEALDDDRLHPDVFARGLVEAWPSVVGGGRATRAAVERLGEGVPWWEAGTPSAGNGAAMRVAPVGLWHAGGSVEGLVRDAALSAVVTHHDPTAVASAVAMAVLVAQHATEYHTPGLRPWRLDQFREVLRWVGEVVPHPAIRERRPDGSTTRLVDRLVEVTLWLDLEPDQAMERTHNGALVLESLPAAVWFSLKYRDDPEEAVVQAASAGRDSDTVASMVGALLGSLHGEDAWPDRWVERLDVQDQLRATARRIHDERPLDPLAPPPSEVDWHAVRDYLARLEGGQHDDVQISFIDELTDAGLLVHADWTRFMQRRGRRLWDRPDEVEAASLDECRRLLIAIWRGDRFNENLLLDAFHRGTVEQLLRRIIELAPA